MRPSYSVLADGWIQRERERLGAAPCKTRLDQICALRAARDGQPKHHEARRAS